MSLRLNRIAIAGKTVRLFGDRKDAIGTANTLTRGTDQQHYAVSAPPHVGWLVQNGVTKELRDYDGVLPDEVIAALGKPQA